MSDGFVAPVRSKRPKNTKGLSLTAEALAPPPLSENGSEDDYNLDAYVTQATPKPAVGQLNGGGGGGEHSLHQSSSTLSVPKVSSISRKKPVGLGIRSTRPAPDVPSKSDGVLLSPSGSFMSNASSNHSISSRAEMERELASMEISSSSTRSGSKSKKSAAENGDEPKSTTKKTKKKSEKPESEFSELKDEDLKLMGELGCGNGGTVNKVIHKSSGKLMAKKLILIDAKPAVRKQILRELQIMYHCSSEWIVTFYGAFLCDVHVGICMEFMDRGSLDGIYKKHGAVPIGIVGKIAENVLHGLTYLYDEHRIIHRDIKPSNILVNSKGEIKIADFGVSGQLINSVANTFVGTSTYMSPERIQGGAYSVKSDVWSLGISLIELALGRFPFMDDDSNGLDSDNDSDLEEMRRTITGRDDAASGRKVVEKRDPGELRKKQETKAKAAKAAHANGGGNGGGVNMSILDLLQHIVNEPAPRLVPPGKYGHDAEHFVEDCLQKDPKDRKNPKELLQYTWIVDSAVTKADLQAWAESVE